MKPSPVYHWTGILGIGMYILVLLEIPLYFLYTPTPSGTPPALIILLRVLVDMVVCLGLIGFFSGFRTIVSHSAPDFEWMGTFIFSCGLAFSVVALVADSIQAGSVWAANTNPVNPTWVGYGAEGALLIYGPINRLLMTTILFASSTLIVKTRLFPKWTALLGYIFALYNLSFLPTLFYMTTPLDFYSVNGWNIPIAAGLFFVWILIVSIFLIRKKNK